MPTCPICGDLVKPDDKVCRLCGENLVSGAETDLDFSVAEGAFDNWEGLEDSKSPVELQVAPVARPPAAPASPLAAALPPTEEMASPPLPVAIPASTVPPAAPIIAGPAQVPPEVIRPVDSSSVPPAGDRPAFGTRCLVMYGADKKPRHYFPVAKDVTLIGRLDPLRGIFPDIDLAAWLEEAEARHISRKHAVLLHTRATDQFSLRPLAGNTGTQIEQDMVEAMNDYPLTPGTRVILGGVARFKFELVS